MSGRNRIDPDSVAAQGRRLLFMPEPGACGGRLDPDQRAVPDWLAEQIDFHVWPSMAPIASIAAARAVCQHVDWEGIWRKDPALWSRESKLGAPAMTDLWQARDDLAEHGYHLCLDVELHTTDSRLALVVYGAGIVGRMSDAAWRAAAPLLTTCAAAIYEPRPDTRDPGWVRPARPATSLGRRLPTGVRPNQCNVGDWLHTWWEYHDGPLRRGCPCPAHAAVRDDFGPGALTIPRARTSPEAGGAPTI